MNIEDIEREFEASPAGSSIQQEIEIMLQNFGKSHKSASKLSDQPRVKLTLGKWLIFLEIRNQEEADCQ